MLSSSVGTWEATHGGVVVKSKEQAYWHCDAHWHHCHFAIGTLDEKMPEQDVSFSEPVLYKDAFYDVHGVTSPEGSSTP